MAFVNTKNPTLPFAPVQYDRAYQDTLNNILRQYFAQLDNFNTQVNETTNSNTVMNWLNVHT